MNEVVRYNNQMNELSFKGFDEKDLDVFMAICSRMKNLGEAEQKFDYDYLMELTGFDKHQGLQAFHKSLQKMNRKLMQINLTIVIKDGVEKDTVLFPTFVRDLNKRTLTVKVDRDCLKLLNNLGRNFTRFELAEYVKLDGRYSKLIYQHLKQYRTSGWWQVSVEELREELAIPKSMPARNITNKIINPSVDIIKTCTGFKDLEVEVLRSNRRGRAVVGYEFRWEKQINLNQAHRDQQKRAKQKKNSFNNFEQNTYDFAKMEEQLLDN